MADRFDDIDWNRQFRIGVWVAQGILAAFCLTIGGPMLATPAALPEGMGLGFAADLPELAVRTLGLVYLVLGVGLVAPAALRWRPALTPVAAGLVAALQVALLALHIGRGEVAETLSIDVMLLVLAGAILWGRVWFAPIAPR